MRQQYRLESITLRDVGVFEHTHFDFPQIKSEEKDAEKAEIHIFTGPNGCGKSTLLYALAAVFSANPDNNSLIAARFTQSDSKIDLTFSGQVARIRNGLDMESTIPESIMEYNRFKSWPVKFSAFAYSGQCKLADLFVLSLTNGIEQAVNDPFENALSFNNTVRPKVLAQWIANNRTHAALARQDNDLEEATLYDVSLDRISKFIFDVCDLDIRFRLERKPLAISLNVNGTNVNFDVLPDGLKSIIGWVADLALRLESIPWQENRDIFSQPIILFLDEVDIHLHPKWQRRILPAIQKLLPNAQVFVSTHSPFVVGSVEDAFVYRLPDPQRTVCRDPASAEVITPTPSAAGKSYQLILDEVFGIEEQFDVETEALLEKFYQLKKAYLSNPQDDSQLVALAAELSSKGSEVATIVSMELRQITRLVKKG